MELDRAIHNRHSVRKFNGKKPDWRTIIECIDACRYAPMAGNNYVLKFIVIDDEEKIKKIAEASQQRHVGEVQYLVVVCSNPSRPMIEYGKEEGEKWTHQETGAAIENFLLKIQETGLATCWVGYFVEEHVRKILKIPREINIDAILPVGYEAEKPRVRKMKINIDRILYFNEFGNVHMKKKGKTISGD